MENDRLLVIRVLRNLIAGRKVRPSDFAHYLMDMTGADQLSYRFWSRFARDVLAVPDSPVARLLQDELLLGRGVRNNLDRLQVVMDLIDDIESGAPPVKAPPPSAEEIQSGAKALKQALSDDVVDAREAKIIFQSFDNE